MTTLDVRRRRRRTRATAKMGSAMPRLIPIAFRLVALLLFVLLMVGVFVLFADSLASWLADRGATLRERLSANGPQTPFQEAIRGLLVALATGAYVVVPMALVVAVLIQLAEPTKLFHGFVTSLVRAVRLSSSFVTTGRRGRELVPAFVTPTVYVAVAWFLVGLPLAHGESMNTGGNEAVLVEALPT